MLTDIVIPLNEGSRCQDAELRYCLRSIEKHLLNVGRVILVGERPDWIKKDSIVYLRCTESINSWDRAYNIYRKTLKAINEVKDLSESFLFMNDDHFLLRDYHANSFPYYHRGPIDYKVLEVNQPQLKQMRNTVKAINELCSPTMATTDIPVWDYDIHCPILYGKRLYKNIFAKLPQYWPEYGYGIKSLYSNYWINGSSGQLAEKWNDIKIKDPYSKPELQDMLMGASWFSVSDTAMLRGGMLDMLEELYPNKSIFEI